MEQISIKVYKTRYGCLGKVIHWELCKKLKVDHMNKWYMHNQESALENETHKLRWNLEIKTDPLISTRVNNSQKKKKKKKNGKRKRTCWLATELN